MKYNNILKSDLFVFILFILVFYSIFRISGTFNQGYNVYEDNLVITATQSLDTNSYSDVWETMMKDDIEGRKRFRPVFVTYLLTTLEIFGFNLLLINIYLIFLCICTAFLFFRFCVNIGFSVLQGILFSLFTLLGPATLMWSQSTDAEIMGMLILAFALYFLSKSIHSEKHQIFYKFCFVISILFTALSKESFLIIVPAVLFLYLWQYSLKNNTGIIQSIRKNFILVAIISVLLISVAVSLVKLIGTVSSHGYTGIDFNIYSVNTIKDFAKLIFKTNIFLIALLGLMIAVENELFNIRKSSVYSKKTLYSILFLICFMLLIIIPQFMLYYKIGFTERYYLPYLMGFSFFLIYMLKIIFDSKSVFPVIKYFYLGIIVFYLIFDIKAKTIPALMKYSEECKATTNVIETIVNDPDKDLLFVMDPVQNFHEVYSLKIYLESLKGKKDYKYDFIKRDYLSPFYADTVYYNNVLIHSKNQLGSKLINSSELNSDVNNIFICGSLNEKFVEKNDDWFDKNDYKQQIFGHWTFYSKK